MEKIKNDVLLAKDLKGKSMLEIIADEIEKEYGERLSFKISYRVRSDDGTPDIVDITIVIEFELTENLKSQNITCLKEMLFRDPNDISSFKFEGVHVVKYDPAYWSYNGRLPNEYLHMTLNACEIPSVIDTIKRNKLMGHDRCSINSKAWRQYLTCKDGIALTE